MTQTRKALRAIHSSYVELDPTEYEYVESMDLDPPPGSYVGERADYTLSFGHGDITWPGTNFLNAHDSYLKHLLRTSTTSAWSTDDDGRCDHCGAHLRYVIVMKHLPTNSHMAIGQDCWQQRFDYNDKITKDLDRLAKVAKAGRMRSQVAKHHDEWLAADPANADAEQYLVSIEDKDEFEASLFAQLNKRGDLSERQVAAILRSRERKAERVEKQAAEALLPKVPVVEGSGIVITGEVLSTKWVDNDFGGALKMLVRDDRGFKVWGTVPNALASLPFDHASTRTVGSGERVQFTANVEVSRDDEAFGFFKRPRKATLVEVQA